MKVTKSYLKQLIKEELENVVSESDDFTSEIVKFVKAIPEDKRRNYLNYLRGINSSSPTSYVKALQNPILQDNEQDDLLSFLSRGQKGDQMIRSNSRSMLNILKNHMGI